MAGGIVVSVGAGAAVAGDVYAARRGVFSSGSGPAYAPWLQSEEGTAPLRLVRSAILAANAHNSQSWRFVVSPQRIDVSTDPARSLGVVDTYRRELEISVGCAVENLTLSARAAGFVPTVTLAPAGAPNVMARVDLVAGPAQSSELYRAIPDRHTDRAAYQTGRSVPATVLASLDALVTDSNVRLLWLLSPAKRAEFSVLTVAATEAFIADAKQSSDDYAWYRDTREQIQQHRDGITVDAAGVSPVVYTLGKLVPATPAANNSYWLSGTRDRQLPTASGFAIVAVKDASDLAQRLAAGQTWQRLHLWATAHGLAMQPLNQIVERAERERSTTGPGRISAGLDALVDDAGWKPVMPFRLGYPTVTAPASPRRDVHDVVVSS